MNVSSVHYPERELVNAVSALHLVQKANYAIVASLTFLSYDIALTLSREITYIWSERWSFPKIAYLCVRYYGLACIALMTTFALRENNSYDECRHYYIWLCFGGPIIFTTLSNAMLTLRVLAVYNYNRYLLVFSICLVIGQTVTELYATVLVYARIVIVQSPFGLPWPGCPFLGYHSGSVLIAWVANLVTAIIFFLLTLWKFIESAVEYYHVSRESPRTIRVPSLLLVLVEDGTIHFFTLVVALIVLLVYVRGPLGLVSIPWMIAMYSCSTSRLILHLRVFAAHQKGSTPTWHQTFSIRIPFSETHDKSTRPQRSKLLNLKLEQVELR